MAMAVFAADLSRSRGRGIFLLSVALLGLSGAVRAFEFPLTSSQRAQKLVEQGYERIIRGDYNGALNFCDQALKVRLDWAPAYVCRSEARLWLKDPLSDRDARQAMRYDPQSGDPHRLLGLWEYEAGRYAAAIKDFTRALDLAKLKPESVTECYYYRARARIRTGDLKGALQDVTRGLGIMQGVSGSFGDWSFYSLRADIERRQQDFDAADKDERRVVDLIEKRLERHPGEASDLLRRRADSFALLGDFAKAAEEYRRIATSFKDTDPASLLERVLALVMAGNYGEAARELSAILQSQPKRPLMRRMRAMARIASGDSSGAVEDLDTFLSGTAAAPESSLELRAALEQDGGVLTQLEGWQSSAVPRLPALWGRRALVHEMLLEHDEAMALAAKALANDPQEEPAHIARAAAALTAGRCLEATQSLDWLVAAHPDRSFFYWLRGECRCRGERGEARTPAEPQAAGPDDLDGCIADLERVAGIEHAAKAPAFRLASQYRRWLDRRVPAATTEELSKGLRFYDQARSLGALDAADELGRIQTLVDLSALEPGPRRRETLSEAEGACKKLLADDPEDAQLAQICSEIRSKLHPGAKKAARKAAQGGGKTNPKSIKRK